MTEGIKTFEGLQRLLVSRELLERYSRVGFRHIETLVFGHDVDSALFKDKVLYLEYIGRMVVPRYLAKAVYSRMERYCGRVKCMRARCPQCG